ncbi:hypothetical protein CL52_14365 [Stutzerimonas balearica DSM 6083]|uniref:Uncharacterized protein n=1 Tax=Stutzerimonas balearica DSM 6083 TaxID=1123016 RepID=A0A8D4C3T0_9GAMM|nr:hypothetical protein CL52_14365 [Stutzerimonas balearica DSM 6083]
MPSGIPAPVEGEVAAVVELHGDAQVVVGVDLVFGDRRGQPVDLPLPAQRGVRAQRQVGVFLQDGDIVTGMQADGLCRRPTRLGRRDSGEHRGRPQLPEFLPATRQGRTRCTQARQLAAGPVRGVATGRRLAQHLGDIGAGPPVDDADIDAAALVGVERGRLATVAAAGIEPTVARVELELQGAVLLHREALGVVQRAEDRPPLADACPGRQLRRVADAQRPGDLNAALEHEGQPIAGLYLQAGVQPGPDAPGQVQRAQPEHRLARQRRRDVG